MKKTLTVNLNNVVFHIDDDAYEMLQTYLAEISLHLSADERKEVMNDIEARIAELFTEHLQKNKNVINLDDVNKIVSILGKPNQFGDAEDDQTENEKSDSKSEKKNARRFYRDPENAVLGGVAGGIAAYFSWDVTWVRIGLVVLALISAGNFIPIYLLVWIVAPKAVTASQRLEMQGEDVTVDNIKSEINNFKNYVESDKFKQSTNTLGERIIDFLRIIFKAIFGFVGIVLGFVGIILAGVLVLVLMFLIFEPNLIHGFAPEFWTDFSLVTPDKAVLLVIALLLVVGCPLFILVCWAIRIITGRQYTSKTTFLVISILWFAGLFMLYSFSAKTIIHWNKAGNSNWNFGWAESNSPIKEETRTIDAFREIEISGSMELVFTQDSIRKFVISAPELLLPYIKTDLKGSKLKVYCEKGFVNEKITLYVSTDSIFGLVANGASHIKSTSTINTSSLNLELNGASKADLDLAVLKIIKLNVSGASRADIDGSANDLNIDLSGASKVDADELKAQNVVVEASGASRANVYASESIDARASGASNIHCEGNPKIQRKSDNMGSKVSIE
jgi:phage shock protein PspC (stress-responsive transcriptional regulator)